MGLSMDPRQSAEGRQKMETGDNTLAFMLAECDSSFEFLEGKGGKLELLIDVGEA